MCTELCNKTECVCVAQEVITSTAAAAAGAGFMLLQRKEGNNNSWPVQILPAGSESAAALGPTLLLGLSDSSAAAALDGQPE